MDNVKVADSGDFIRNNIKYGSSYQAFKGIFLEYFEESSIHGLRYIGEQKRSALDRLIWLIAVILSIVACFYLLSNIWDKRGIDPVIVTLDGKLTPVWEIPFPMVTVCHEAKTNLLNYDSANYSMENIEYIPEIISQICLLGSYRSRLGDNIPNASKLFKVMFESAPKLTDTFFGKCTSNSETFDCENLFVPVLTEEGICFSYNSIKSEHYRTELYNSRRMEFFDYKLEKNTTKLNWDLENGYTREALYTMNPMPRHAIGATNMESLHFILHDSKENDLDKCGLSYYGFKLSLQTPGEEPQVSKKFINVPFNHKVSLTIKARIVKSSKNLRNYSPERRQCYYQNERYLRYFTVYTQANCKLECQANQTLETCGCVKYSMPRSSSQPICGEKKMACYEEIENNFGRWTFIAKSNLNGNDSTRSTCVDSCLPTCFEIKYKAELEHQVPLVSFRNYRWTDIILKFEDDHINGLTRSELYSTTDFIANCGGLLGLFMGISILSLIELVYFFTIRLWWNLQSRKTVQHWARKIKKNNIPGNVVEKN